MSRMDDAERIDPGSRTAWGRWLAEHHADSTGVWLAVPDRTAVGEDALSYENAVREALCWGWIDGTAPSGRIWFSPRRPGSGWAATNKARLEILTAEGRMQPAGLAAVDVAKANGSWSVLDGPEAGIEPPELTAALDAEPAARTYWDGLSVSARKYALTQVATAKREATRTARIATIVQRCAAGERPDR